jgi:hypothetical protein
VVPLVRHGIERWADEDAARAVGDRHTAAAAIARAGLARAHAQRDAAATPRLALGTAHHRTADRVTALLAAPPTRPARAATVAMALLLLTVLSSLTTTTLTVHASFERAEQHQFTSTR